LCLVHLLQQGRHDAALAGGELDGRGNVLDVGNLTTLLRACPRGVGGQPALWALRLDGATIKDDATLLATDIAGPFNAAGARFEGDLDARDVRIGGMSDLRSLEVTGRLDLRDLRAGAAVDASRLQVTDLEAATACFDADLSLAGARVNGRCHFARMQVVGTFKVTDARFAGECFWSEMVAQHLMGADVRFDGPANLTSLEVSGACRLSGARFEDTLWLTGAEVGSLDLSVARFAGDLGLSVTAKSDVNLCEAELSKVRALGSVTALHLDLSRATVERHVALDARVGRLTCFETQFPQGAYVRVWGTVDLTGARFGAGSTVAAGTDLELRDHEAHQVEGTSDPRLLSVRFADVTNLAIDSLDLSTARFTGAHGLDRMRVEGDFHFAETPGFPWARRAVLAEEAEWRAEHRAYRWRRPEQLPEVTRTPDAADIAGAYRAPRKGREDAKDYPGASELYYGEMEMRRQPSPDGGVKRASAFERRLVVLYWLVSGYGLRSSRSLALLVALIVGGGLVAHAWAFPEARSLGQSLLWEHWKCGRLRRRARLRSER
jgi:hypothetical protein